MAIAIENFAKKPKNIKFLALITLIIAAVIIYFLFFDKKFLVFENARLELSGAVISSPYGGEIQQLYATIGESVSQQSILLSFDPTPFRIAHTQALNNLNLALAGENVDQNYISLELTALIELQNEQIAQDRLNEEMSRMEYEHWTNEQARLLVIMRTPNISQDDYAIARQEEANARLMKDSAAVRLEEMSLIRADSERVLQSLRSSEQSSHRYQTDIGFWQEEVLRTQEAMNFTDFKSSLEGVVTDIYISPGMHTVPFQPLLKISPPALESFTVSFSVSLLDAEGIRIGQQAFFEGGVTQFEAQVVSITPYESSAQIVLLPTHLPQIVSDDIGIVRITVE